MCLFLIFLYIRRCINTMYEYKHKLINNHYIVTIGDKNYLIDTGCPKSFSLTNQKDIVTIDGKEYELAPNKLTPYQTTQTLELIGAGVSGIDGFIGMDIINQTSLTIYKDGRIVFGVVDLNEEGMPLHTSQGYIYIDTSIGKYAIDTGAMYGYGAKWLFRDIKPYTRCRDYNPGLGVLVSDLYRLLIGVNNQIKKVDMCDNFTVQQTYLPMINCDVIGSITTLFDEVCVIDMKNKVLKLK